MAKEGQTHVIPETLYLPAADSPSGWINCNLRTTFKKIVKRAGLEPWPRLFHNLRASCESDLAREYPITTVCKWLGNTVTIAARHYVQVTDEDFHKAANAGKPTAQNAAQSVHAKARHSSPGGQADHQLNPNEKSRKVASDNYLRLLADFGCKSLFGNDLQQMAGTGFEPATSRL